MHSKTLISQDLQACKNYVHLLTNCAFQNLDLLKCSRLQELFTSIDQLNALQNLNLNDCSKLQKLPISIGQLSAL
jgi:hypothetical protein